MSMRCVVVLTFLSLCLVAEARDPLRNCRQCLVVTTDSWWALHGTMSIFERDKGSKWRRRGSPIPIVVGRAGLGWGRGLTDTINLPGPIKKEGDNKAPAGIFVLPGVFGYAAKAETKMPYRALSPDIVGVDDAQSRYYNRLIDASKIDQRDWRTAEKMFREDNLYKWGVVVNHNVPAKPGAGSCIFLHIWRGPAEPTVGCTAMAERNVVDLIHWLDPRLHPVLVQLPRTVYDDLRIKWNLPEL